MSSIGSIHFVQQNQAYPAMEHARALAKGAELPEELAPRPEVPTVAASSESAASSEDFERDYAQKEREQKHGQGKNHHGGENEAEEGANADAPASSETEHPGSEELLGSFFGQEIYGARELVAAHHPTHLDKSV